jgi:integrase
MSCAAARRRCSPRSSPAACSPVSTLVGLRDRALIGVMTYTFARIGAVVAMRVEDYYPAGKRWWVRLHEKGGKRHEMSAHHKLDQFILFRSAAGKTSRLTGKRDAPGRRLFRWSGGARPKLGFKIKLGCYVFRATGITAYLEAGEHLENAQATAAHENPRTTKL